MLPLDLHVLSLSLAFILSQDQTLHCTFYFFIRLSLNSSFIVVKFYDGGIFYLVLILHFCCFQSFKELVSVCVETDCKVTTFFWIYKIFQKKYLFFLFNHLLFNSQATSLDCGCKVTAFSQTTKIFLSFFWNFFITCCTSKRKILNILRFIRFSTTF